MERCSGRAYEAVNHEYSGFVGHYSDRLGSSGSSAKAMGAGMIIDGLLDILISVMKIPAPFARLAAQHFKIMDELAQVNWQSQ